MMVNLRENYVVSYFIKSYSIWKAALEAASTNDARVNANDTSQHQIVWDMRKELQKLYS